MLRLKENTGPVEVRAWLLASFAAGAVVLLGTAEFGADAFGPDTEFFQRFEKHEGWTPSFKC